MSNREENNSPLYLLFTNQLYKYYHTRASPSYCITNDVVKSLLEVIGLAYKVECFLGDSDTPSDESCPSEAKRCEGEHQCVAGEDVKQSSFLVQPLVG